MGASVLKRFLITLLALVFIGANLAASCNGASTMENAAAMTAATDHPCSDCSSGAPPAELAKIGCGALACAGMVGLPVRQMIVMPDFAEFLHPPRSVDEMAGISIKPDPFPPRPAIHA